MDPKKTLKEEYEKAGYLSIFNELEAAGRLAVQCEVGVQFNSHKNLGGTRFGGTPDLPIDFPWPYSQSDDPETAHPMAFVAQINLKELANAVSTPLPHLPTQGILYFFRQDSDDIGNYGLDPEDFKHTKVVYFDGDLTTLEHTEAPEELDEEYEIYTPCGCKFTEVFSVPNDSFSPWGEPLDDVDEDVQEAYFEHFYNIPDAQILGHPYYVQGPVEGEACLAASTSDNVENLDPALKTALAAPFGREETDWRLLLQVDSIDSCDMMWGDMGSIYFMITEDDLKNQRFDRILCCFQCG